jgi:aminopeptidase N
VWSQILSTLAHVKSIFSEDSQIADGLRKFTLKLVGPAVEKIGWEFASEEELLTGQLRSLLISNAGASGHEATISEAKKRFDLFSSGKDAKAIHPSLRLSVFRVVIKNGGKDEYEVVKKFHATTTSVDGKEIALQSLGRVQSPELAKDFLDFTFSPAVAVQDRHSSGVSLASNGKVRQVLWDYVKENWDSKVFPELSSNMVVLERFLRSALSKFSSFEAEKDIAAFFEPKDQKGYDRGLKVVRDTIIGSAKYKERDAELVKEWLSAHGYA